MNSPSRSLLPLTVNVNAEKSGCFTMAAIKGVNRSFMSAVTTRTKGGTDHNADCQDLPHCHEAGTR